MTQELEKKKKGNLLSPFKARKLQLNVSLSDGKKVKNSHSSLL